MYYGLILLPDCKLHKFTRWELRYLILLEQALKPSLCKNVIPKKFNPIMWAEFWFYNCLTHLFKFREKQF